MTVRLTPERAGQIVARLAWALAAAFAIDFVAILILFGTGP